MNDKSIVQIAMAANDKFVPYLMTTIESIVRHASQEFFYEIVVMIHDATEQTKCYLCNWWSEYSNIRIRLLDPVKFLKGKNFYVRGHFSVETYYRLLLQDLLPDIDKVLYIDADLIVQRDLADLFQTDVNGYLVAATLDADTAGLYNGYFPEKKQYMDKVLKIEKPYQYFQAGVMLFNLSEFRKSFQTEKLLDFATSYEWELLDQDVLNYLCQGRVKYIDMAWNVMVDWDGIRIKDIISLAPENLQKLYLNAREKPYIIHYAGPQKPWNDRSMDFGEFFWKYFCNTPFYEDYVRTEIKQICEKVSIDKSRYVIEHELYFSEIVKRKFYWKFKNLFKRK